MIQQAKNFEQHDRRTSLQSETNFGNHQSTLCMPLVKELHSARTENHIGFILHLCLFYVFLWTTLGCFGVFVFQKIGKGPTLSHVHLPPAATLNRVISWILTRPVGCYLCSAHDGGPGGWSGLYCQVCGHLHRGLALAGVNGGVLSWPVAGDLFPCHWSWQRHSL